MKPRFENARAVLLMLVIFAFLPVALAMHNKNDGKEKHSETLIIAADRDYSPYSFISPEGDYLGYDVDLIHAIGKRMKKNIRLELLTWSDAQKKLDEGLVDALMGMTYSEKRLSKVDFSAPLANDAYVAFSRSKEQFDIEHIHGKKLCTIENDAIREAFIIPYKMESETRFFPAYSDCFKSVAKGESDFAIAPYLTGKKLAQALRLDNIDASGPVLNNSIYCIGVKRGNAALLQEINQTIRELSCSGELKTIREKWLVDYVNKSSIFFFLKDHTLYIITIVLMISFFSYYVNEKINQKRREKILLTDPVTNSGNFNQFVLQSEALLKGNCKPDAYTIVSFNIRNFKMFNESFGYKAGDALLCSIARIVTAEFSTLAFSRVSADNFVMMIDAAETGQLAEKMRLFSRKLNEAHAPTRIFVYFGIYVVDDPTIGINAIHDRAQIARRTIENSNEQHFAFYDTLIHERLLHCKNVEERMASALENREFAVYLQPKYDLLQGVFSGSEALARWKDGKGGIIPPADFIDIFEKNGFIRQLDIYIFEEVCKTIRDNAGNEDFFSALPISVNISRRHFSNAEFIDKLVDISDRYGVSRKLLELEITETAFIELINDNYLIDILMKAKEKDFSISLDDFGSGYTSLAMVAEFPLDTIKIDRVFLLSPRKQKILAKVVDIAKYLNMKVVCEGVDSADQIEILKQFGCDIIQGFYYARPMPIENYIPWAKAQAGKSH